MRKIIGKIQYKYTSDFAELEGKDIFELERNKDYDLLIKNLSKSQYTNSFYADFKGTEVELDVGAYFIRAVRDLGDTDDDPMYGLLIPISPIDADLNSYQYDYNVIFIDRDEKYKYGNVELYMQINNFIDEYQPGGCVYSISCEKDGKIISNEIRTWKFTGNYMSTLFEFPENSEVTVKVLYTSKNYLLTVEGDRQTRVTRGDTSPIGIDFECLKTTIQSRMYKFQF